MSRILEVELYIRDESGCSFGTKREEVFATCESGIWSIQGGEKPRKNEKKGEGASRRQAVLAWFWNNIGAD